MENIAKILKNAPEGLKLWSDVFGEVLLIGVMKNDSQYSIILAKKSGSYYECDAFGRFMTEDNTDCLCTLWPSEKHRDWGRWQDVLFKDGDLISLGEPFMIISGLDCINARGDSYTIQNAAEWVYATTEERKLFFRGLKRIGKKKTEGVLQEMIDEEKKKNNQNSRYEWDADILDLKPIEKTHKYSKVKI